MLLDIDDFGAFNETHGRAGGDAILIGLGNALRVRLRRTDLLARVGADEFAVLLPRDGDAAHVAEALQQLTGALHVPVGDSEAHVTASVGTRLIDRTALSADVVLTELEQLTLKPHPANARVGYPSAASRRDPRQPRRASRPPSA